MKIAIMTQPLGKNYGGIMQAWALQQVLKRMGHEVVTIDRQPDQPGLTYKAARLAYRAGMKAIGKRKAPINFEKHLPTILQHTQSFIDQNITMSEPLYSTQQLRAHFDGKNYDAVIVGSDQTWRPQYSPNIYNFYLDFAEDLDIKRIAYAASFGTDDWEFNARQQVQCLRLAQRFDTVSVREQSGIELCKQHLNISATLALDPTLLLDSNDYEILIKDKLDVRPPGGLFTYLLDPSQQKSSLVDLLVQHTRLAPYSCQPMRWLGTHSSTAPEDYVIPKVKNWLASFISAKFVVTDSFHGMVFALIFKKDFLVINNQNRGGARFTSLLGQLELLDRLIEPTYMGNIDSKLSSIDFESVSDKLMNLKNKSFTALEQSLQ